MASFPTLKTGAVAQYPAGRTIQTSTQVYRFLDGSEQRFAAFAAPLHKWQIKLDLLDEAELSSLENFLVSQKGRSGSFSFTDPWDGTVYPTCSFDSDSFTAELKGPDQGTTEVIVRENR
jgi:hypothetical protein